ncbi:MAG: family transcriptional regulator [Myxococcaceae bacterium]|nr:family transcriptional regulator [Myxococcaceae bacterium]
MATTTSLIDLRGSAPRVEDASAPAHEGDPVARAIEMKQRLRSAVQFLEAARWAAWRGVTGVNPSAALGKYKRARRLFAVTEGRSDLYPVFQFDENAEPLEGIARVLAAVPPDLNEWALLSWFESRNHLLDEKKPSDLIASAPERVAAAAQRFYARE